MDIEHASWKNFDIYTCGCTGLELLPADLHKFGRLMADGGVYHGSQLVPKQFIEDMLSEGVDSEERFDPKRALPKQRYGYFMWKTPQGHAYCDGTNGIYLVVLADGNTVISTTGEQADMKPIMECFRSIL